jgi:hypothetical protein
MTRSLIGAVLFVPAVLSAQAEVKGKAAATAAVTAPHPQASAQARAHANANAAFNAPERFSANGRAKLEAMYADARKRDLPPEPMARRVAEGEAKGKSEAEILAAAGRVKSDLELTQQALIAAGRPKPRHEEVERGAMLMARGATSAQIETMARHAPSDRSLVVAFDVVSQLSAQGLPVTQALSRVQAKLDSRASDATLLTLAGSANAGAGVGANVGRAPAVSGAAGATAQGAANAAAKGGATGVVGSVTGSTTGVVTGVVKKP